MNARRRSNSPHPVLDRSVKLRASVNEIRWDCLDEAWSGWHVPHRFVCSNGHVVPALPSGVLRQIARCQQCHDDIQFAELRRAAARDGVVCLSSKWEGVTTPYRFSCPCGHEWLRAPRHGLKKEGLLRCPECVKAAANAGKRLHDGLDRLKRAAADRGGRCLAKRYEGWHQRYRFRCSAGHEWHAVGGEVIRGSWCSLCALEDKRHSYRLSDGLERLQAAAAAKGGCCESGTYFGLRGRYWLRCGQGHRWEAAGTNIVNGSWCYECSKENKRLGIDAAHEAAHARGGQCLSNTYVNAATKLAWVCHRGHMWHAPLSTIRQGHWCRECANAARITNKKSRARARYGSSPRHSKNAA
ncbi:hypothetical protein OOT46_02520 [Aquabacterium sp. A7-Y]|uniref:hypothetical protein n=1 Tax=Aquabacterium sp. A7-Y TaxID=1349605 RepID=UPI00223DB3FC|nr:hypothetical protein [Aquabacterium sp. A7-Y]MCW7536728.1 hypothetical protein [Aquabacterium sp. A7-Y]